MRPRYRARHDSPPRLTYAPSLAARRRVQRRHIDRPRPVATVDEMAVRGEADGGDYTPGRGLGQ